MTTQHLHRGTDWLGTPREPTDSLLVRDGVIAAIGSEDVDSLLSARSQTETNSVEEIDLDGGFIMPSFGDGHAHPIFGGMEAEGPQVRACSSVDEIVAEVRRYAEAHPEDEWINGASYDGSLVAEDRKSTRLNSSHVSIS